jgi:hypothetical protein
MVSQVKCPMCGNTVSRELPVGEGTFDCPHCYYHGNTPESANLSDASSLVAATKPRPWIRYWARMIDITVFGMLLGVGLVVFMPAVIALPEIFFSMLILLSWVLVESVILTLGGTTPGKWLLRIELTASAGQPDFLAWLVRSFTVWWQGLGVGFPLVSLFTLAYSHKCLLRDGVTSWDRDGGFVVTHGRIGAVRIAVAAAYSVLFVAMVLSQSVAAQP